MDRESYIGGIKVVRTPVAGRKLIPWDEVQVYCNYNKGRRRVMLSAYPAERSDFGSMIAITNGEYAEVEPMTRLNRKRLEDVRSKFRNELSLATGQAWALVERVCAANGLAITDAPANAS